jgi:hypothetical protein
MNTAFCEIVPPLYATQQANGLLKSNRTSGINGFDPKNALRHIYYPVRVIQLAATRSANGLGIIPPPIERWVPRFEGSDFSGLREVSARAGRAGWTTQLGRKSNRVCAPLRATWATIAICGTVGAFEWCGLTSVTIPGSVTNPN